MKLLLYLFFLTEVLWATSFSNDVIANVRKGVVSISTRVLKSAYSTAQESHGSGFIADKKRGLIITNRHVVASASLGKHEVTFHNGKQVDATIYYYDPIYDFALLKVDPRHIPKEARQLALHPEGAKRDVDVFLIGKNAGQDFSFQVGRVTSMDETDGYIQCQAMRISVNTRGGSSGSAVCDASGRVIGLNHSGTADSHALALSAGYIKPVLTHIQEKGTYTRQSTGAEFTYYYLDRAVKYDAFPTDIAREYERNYPESQNKVIVVQGTRYKSPAAKVLRPGDIILKVNGQETGSNIWMIENACQEGKGAVTFTLVRHGKIHTLTVGLYSVEENKIKRLFSFAGGVFYEADEGTRARLGIAPRTLLLTNIQPGGGLHQKFESLMWEKAPQFICIRRINNIGVKSLDDFIGVIKTFAFGDRFSIHYKNFGAWVGYNGELRHSRPLLAAEGDLYPSDGPPLIHELNTKTHVWETKNLWKDTPRH
ncbi:MAG: serine protease [Alphaproteobacteria bacterium]|nr:MAG: serine protease [Alphaproteobacteria bacterium]